MLIFLFFHYLNKVNFLGIFLTKNFKKGMFFSIKSRKKKLKKVIHISSAHPRKDIRFSIKCAYR